VARRLIGRIVNLNTSESNSQDDRTVDR